mmetsp:Transcript_17594/g.48572  ORF Transcript_17594/g.48572 Transcript_17594/m.48572 type:complete len:95 (-) Transcript_17594:640-924(-)
MRVPICGKHLADAVTDDQDGDIESAAAQVEDHDGFIGLLLESIGQRGRRGLIQNPQNLQACYCPRILGRLTLGVIEVCRDCNDRLSNLRIEECS